MPGVFREISLTWNGRDYTLVPSNKLLRRVEGKGDLSIPAMAIAFSQNKPRMSEAAFVIAEFLKEAGAQPASKDYPLEDEVYDELINGGAEATTALIGSLFEAIIPQERLKKNEDQNEPRKKLKK
jgi:hypothetical protein